ncbi:MAG: PEP/pyruvate-binding domain-containing protein [Candidatus Methanofastidiosia archaeon]|jgi:pyruvate,water dikinase
MKVETKYEKESSSEGHILWWGHADPPEFVVNIEEKCEMELVGGKAFNISQMVQKGLLVPLGFCVTTEAYTYFMDFNNIAEDDECISDKIREALMPPLLSEVVCDAYRLYLQSKPCAVRSSSPVEDLKNASFAGQYESFLNVQCEDALLEAVKKCWASLWSRSAVEYRKKMGIKNKDIKMAVLVQEMIPAEASGVLFTEDPMVIEGVWGLGEALVGGKAVPDRFIVNRDSFNVKEQEISHKHGMSTLNSSGGIDIIDVPENLKDAPVLNDEHIRELCDLGKRVEELFGHPQDIEWALYEDKIMLLQARPVTVKQKPTVWSRANAADTQPGYVTYLSRIPENKPDDIVLGLRPLLIRFGIKDIPDDIKFRGYIYGHVYLNMTTVHDTLGGIPGLSPEVLDQSLGHTSEEEVTDSKLGFSEMMKLIPGTLRVMRFFMGLPQKAEKVIPQSMALIEAIKHKNLQEMSAEELEQLVWEMYERNSQVFQVHSVTALAVFSLFGVLQKLMAKIEEEGSENLLTIGLEGMSSSQLGVEMWQLAQIAAESPKVSELILSRKKDTIQKLKQFPESVSFLTHLSAFMDEYGDRCSEELELSTPRWEEDPNFVLSMVANFLDSDANPAKTMEEQKKMRLKATERIRKKLSKNPLEALLFEKMLQKTQQYIVVRENLKTTWMKGLSTIRTLYMAIAEKLVKEGILKSKEDIFYLKATEVSDIISDNLRKGQFEDHIEERKREKEKCKYLEVPEVIVGEPPPIEELKFTVESEEQLEGTGCSHGMVTGKARVVLNPRECSKFKEGEILVAPITDPGWSPLFVTAGGLVMELGGTLSHGVIIAREYGIPAVVGVKNATKIIKTGQTITVDGNKGIVYIRE